MRRVEYVVQVYTEDYDWCLESPCGKDRKKAERLCTKYSIENPNKKYRVRAIKSDKAWWNDPFLAN